jgi:hypothetical protein
MFDIVHNARYRKQNLHDTVHYARYRIESLYHVVQTPQQRKDLCMISYTMHDIVQNLFYDTVFISRCRKFYIYRYYSIERRTVIYVKINILDSLIFLFSSTCFRF